MKVITQRRSLTIPRCIPCMQAILVVGLYVATYRSVFLSLVREWYEHENFSYGFLIPVIFLYLVWQERKVFEESFGGSGWGAISLASAVIIGLLGNALGEPFVSRVSIVLSLGGLIHLFFGSSVVRRLVFPLTYLFLMVPPPYVVVKEVSYYLKMFDSVVAAEALQLIGVPVYRDSYFLHLPNITLEVADVCSGIASLFAMAALGTLYVYYLPVRRGAKVAAFLGVLLFPIAANLFRIFLVGASVYHFGPVMLQAFFHHFTGTFTFLLSLVMLLLWGETLRRNYPDTIENKDNPSTNAPRVFGSPDSRRPGAYPFVSAVLIFGSALLFADGESISRVVALNRGLDTISRTLGPYRETAPEWTDVYSDPNSEIHLSRAYAAPEGPPVEIFVGYLSRQSADARLHSPKLVFPRGWEYSSMENIEIQTNGGGIIAAIWLVTKKTGGQRGVLYWYQVRRQTFGSDLRNRLELIRGMIFRGRTDGAVVRLATPINDTEPAERAKERLVAFSGYLYAELREVLP